jgi:ketosteroid isomerase-like protein
MHVFCGSQLHTFTRSTFECDEGFGGMNVTSVIRAAVITASIVLPAAAAQRGGSEADTKSVQQVFDKYLESVKTADVAIASDAWSHRTDVIAVTPFGRFKGWQSVRDNIYVNFLQKAFSERKLEPSNVEIHTAGNAAWLVFDWSFSAKTAAGQPIATKGWESQVYQRTPEGWRIVALHYSVPPPVPQ